MVRLLKLAVISFVIFSVFLYLMSLLIPSQVRISRAVNIEAAPAKIIPMIADTSNWKKWNVMNTGQIDIKIISSDSEKIATEWHYRGRTIHSVFNIIPSGNLTVVQWYFDFRLKWYPWEKFGSITFDKQFGAPMEISLNNLTKLITNSP
jgi:hypothetical protein